MNLSCFELLNFTFKTICGIAAVFMVGFWIFNYHENDDVSVIQYVPLDTTTDISYPELSICIAMPFIYQNLSWNSSVDVSAVQYNRYLNGLTSFREEYRRINFDNVTLNLLEYVQNVVIYKRDENETTNQEITCNGVKDCPYVKFKHNYVGTTTGPPVMYRCFGFEIDRQSFQQNDTHIDSLLVVFKPDLDKFFNEIRYHDFGQIFLVFNLPGQMIKGIRTRRPIWKKPANAETNMLFIKVNSMEILRRRNKRKEQCLVDWASFDDMVLKKYDETRTCSPPYRKSGKPSCTTMREISDSMYDSHKMRKNYGQEPCEEMTNIVFREKGTKTKNIYKESLKLVYVYPLSTKVIHQIKAIDFQALIGNIGGYIGLFLGKKYHI